MIIAIISFGIAAGILLCLFIAQVKRADKAEAKAVAYSQALAELKLRAERLRETASQDTRIQERLKLRAEHLRETAEKDSAVKEAVDAEREKLFDTPDSDLAHRANSLFGVSDSTTAK